MRFKLLTLAASLIAASAPVVAADLFTVNGTVTGATTETKTFSFKRAEDAIDAAKGSSLQSRFSNYTGVETAALDLNFRGLGMEVGFYTPHDTTMVFSVTSLGIHHSFAGATRDESQEMYSDFMKKNGGDILDQIYKKLAEVSPGDPIAGNPNSLMGRMVASDFNTAFNDVGSNIGSTVNGKAEGLVGIGAQFSSLRQNGVSNNSLTIPLSYTVRNDIDPRRQFIINVPVNYTDVEGSKGASIGIGGAYRKPMNDNWTLTPALNYGVAISRDQAAVGHAVSASLTSTYVFRNAGYDVVIGNMIGLFRTLKLSAEDYSYNPKISNTLFRNGVMLSQPVTLMGKKMAIEYSLIDTRFTGTELYNMRYDEISVTLGTNKASSARSFMRAGLTYLFAPGTKGVTLNLGYWF